MEIHWRFEILQIFFKNTEMSATKFYVFIALVDIGR